MKPIRRFTNDEDLVIIGEIEKSPHNLSQAFRAAAIKLDRDWRSIRARWYNTLRNKKGAVFFLTSGKECTVNGKNVVLIRGGCPSMGKKLFTKLKNLFSKLTL